MKYLAMIFASMGLLFLTACGGAETNATEGEETTEQVEETVEEPSETTEAEETPNIVGVASANESFSTLVAAVAAAELVEVLSGEGPFTVFAPVNAAFEKLPEGTVATLLEPESKETLTSILTYHVVSGEFKAADVVAAINAGDGSFTIPTVQGGNLTARLVDGNVVLTDAKGGTSTVVTTDVAASNGVIHVIDTVVMP